ncbi:MAG: polysaccharide deacetylase family protein, partial [Selenomonas artemidis]
MDFKKLIGGRQFWTIIAVLAILLGALLLLAKPQDKSEPVPTPAADDTQVLVLNYHMVNSMFISLAVEPEDFDWQMKYLVDHGYHTITPDELYDFLAGTGELPERPVLITFDDGYVDNYTTAYPILKKYNLKATIFVVTGFLSKRKGYLTWDQLREMEQHGITIESHTVTHAPLPELSDDRIREELV